MVELDHSFTNGKPIEDNWEAILDLERLVPCVEGGSVTEATGPESVKAEIKVKMGAMSMTFTGTVAVIEQDADAHRAVLQVKSREAGGQGHANADVTFTLSDGGADDPHRRADHRQGGVDGRGRRADVLDALINDFTVEAGGAVGVAVARIAMRRTAPGEVPPDGGTAVQEHPDRPVFRGNGPDDYVCVECGNVLAVGDAARVHEPQAAGPLRPVPDGERRRSKWRASTTERRSRVHDRINGRV